MINMLKIEEKMNKMNEKNELQLKLECVIKKVKGITDPKYVMYQ